jgi:GT2 family glycosyltransferase
VRSRADADKIDYISGGSFFTHLGNFRQYGLLPEEYFLYWEETDWCHHVKESGVQFQVCESAVCYDKGGTSVGSGFLAEYYYSLNALRFLRKYNPKFIPTVLFFNLFRVTKRLAQRRPGRARASVKASFDFLTGNYASALPKREAGPV